MAERARGRVHRLDERGLLRHRRRLRSPVVIPSRDAFRIEPVAPVPGDDGFGFDAAIRDRVIPFFRFLYERYWRVDVEGIEHVPDTGAALLVANHSGAIPFDGAMIVTAVYLRHPQQRAVRFLYDRFVDSMPGVGTFYRRVGGAPASYVSTARLVANGQLVMTFPEGLDGVAKPFTERYRLRPFSSSFVRLSLNHRVPIIPVAVIGAEEAYPLVGRLEDAGKLLGVPYIPVTPFFPLFGIAGALPLPTKWYIRFGRPIEFYRPAPEGRMNPGLLPPRELARRVRRRIQTMVSRLRRQRPSIFFG
jgi:1-acyl-sn-glycerol-3-phosphate acyltransferase